jgi:hypothetical protein
MEFYSKEKTPSQTGPSLENYCSITYISHEKLLPRPNRYHNINNNVNDYYDCSFMSSNVTDSNFYHTTCISLENVTKLLPVDEIESLISVFIFYL